MVIPAQDYTSLSTHLTTSGVCVLPVCVFMLVYPVLVCSHLLLLCLYYVSRARASSSPDCYPCVYVFCVFVLMYFQVVRLCVPVFSPSSGSHPPTSIVCGMCHPAVTVSIQVTKRKQGVLRAAAATGSSKKKNGPGGHCVESPPFL